MADTQTPNLGLTKIEIAGSDDTWGDKLNENADKIDAQVSKKTETALKADKTYVDDQDTALNAAIVAASFPAGTRLLFQQTNAPTGWTKDAAQNDKALRVVSGAAGGGGSLPFTTAFASRGFGGSTDSVATSGTVRDTALSVAQMPAHEHLTVWPGSTGTDSPSINGSQYIVGRNDPNSNQTYDLNGTANAATAGRTTVQGGGAPHGHSFSGGAHAHSIGGSLDMSVAYVDVIIAVKN